MGYVIISKAIIHKNEIHYSDKLTALHAKKKRFEGPKPTTRMTKRHCWPMENDSRDWNPQPE
jgi:hypothetical protein